MVKKIENIILQFVSIEDYELGLKVPENRIFLAKSSRDEDIDKEDYTFNFLDYIKNYNVYIIRTKNKFQFYCSCTKFRRFQSCEHLASCLICYSDTIFAFLKTKSSLEDRSKFFLKHLKQSYNTYEGVRQKIKLVSSLNFDMDRHNRIYVTLKVKIGDKKLYVLNKKFWDFLDCYNNEEVFHFGKDFIYDPHKYYFDKKDEDFLHYLKNTFSNSQNFYMDDAILKQYLALNDSVLVENIGLVEIKNGLFFDSFLTLKDDNYLLDLHCDFSNVYTLDDDYEYIWYNKNIYHLNYKEQHLYQELLFNDLNELLFDKKQFLDFKKYFLPYLKKQITVDNSVPLVVSKDPKVSYYFDLDDDFIKAKIVFAYDDYEVIFNKIKDSDIVVRDAEFENKCFREIASYGFKIKNAEVILDDVDDIGSFLAFGLDELGSKYAVYTSEKLKETNVIRKPSVSSSFHLGMNQILNYHLELEGVKEDELKNIFASLKQRKKYYRLKSGDLLNISSDEVKELSFLQDELQFDMATGTIPKFRALYLDSLKSKSNIIHTDDSFNKFIDNFKEYKNCDISFSENEKQLRDYQMDGVKWLYTIYKCGFGGILADEMGLGKSFQTIVFLRKVISSSDKVLIVVPTSLVYNWAEEFKKFGSDMHYAVFSGNKKIRLKELEDYDGNIYITSYGLLKEDYDFYNNLTFKVMIIDEAQAIKNPLTDISKTVKKINASVKFALTGTPIENSVIELWNIFDFIMPGFLGNVTNFKQKYKMKDDLEEINDLLDNLRKQIKPFLLRRKKSDVAKELPDKIVNTIIIDMEEEQKKIYAAAVLEANMLMDKAISNGGFIKNKMIILSLLTKLRQICITPAILFTDYKKRSSKFEQLIKVVKECILNGHKILLFTSFKTALELVKKEFAKEKISSYTIAGDVSSKKRMELTKAFNNDDTNVFLIMLKSGGTGLNLTSADVVIHLDLWWNPQAENQATDRTHRIGQKNVVEVIKIVCKDTVEEKILNLQEKKMALSDKLIEKGMDEASFISNLTEEDVRNLLKYENDGL